MQLTGIKIEHIGHVPEELEALVLVGAIAGECYNSSKEEQKCTARALSCIRRGHHSPWEHVNITLKCTVDRGVSHALVRHRHCAFQQSSTIYQKYDDLEFIDNNVDPIVLQQIEKEYARMIDNGMKPGQARDVLPNCLATNLIITTNFRQWMYMIQRRTGPGDSNNMHIWARKVREWFQSNYPNIISEFDKWYEKHPL